MSDVNANIGVQIDTSSALAELKNLQRQLANFHASIAKTSAAATAAQKGLQTNLLNSINATGQFTATMGNVRTSTESFTHALESNKLSMREYFRYAGGASKTFGRLFKQEFDTIGKVAEERVKKMQTQYIKMGRDANGAIKAMAITPQTLNMNDYATKTAMAAQKQALFNQVVRQGSTSLLNFGKNTQWAGRQLMVGFTIPLAYFGTTASKVFMDLEAQAVKFKRVYGDMFTTTEQTNKALADVQALAEGFTKYGVAVSKTMDMASQAAAMGKTGADLTAQVAQATRLAVLGNVEQSQALETTVSLTNAFGIAAEDLGKKINFLNSVENQTVVSIEDLTIAIPKAGPVVKQLGGNVEDLAFFLTAMKEGGINASEGANALKSGLASLINPSKKASEMLAGLGINIKGIVEANKGDLKNTVIGFAQALDTLAPLERSRAIEQLFGKFQFARLSTLFQNITKDGTQASKVLQLAGASVEELAILSERELKTVENAVGTKFKGAIEELKLAIAPIGKTFLQAVTPIVQVIGKLLDKFNGLGDGTKKFIVIATTLVGIIGPTLLMTFGLVANGVANIIKLFLALRGGFLKLGGNSKVLAEQTNYLNTEQLESATVAASLNQAHTRLTQSFTAESSAVRALRNAYIEATVAAANFARANPGMMMMPKSAGKGPKKFAGGATYVPGTGNKDTVPSVLTPGEAVIPRNIAQDPRFQPIIDAMVNGKLQAFDNGTSNAQPFGNSPKFEPKIDLSGAPASAARSSGSYTRTHQLIMDRMNNAQVTSDGGVRFGGKVYPTTSQKTALALKKRIEQLIADGYQTEKIVSALDRNVERGRPMTASQLDRRLSIGRGSSTGTSAPSSIRNLAKQSQSGFMSETRAIKETLSKQGVVLTPAQEKNLFNVQASHIEETRNAGVKEWKANNLVADLGYVNNYINTVKGKLGTDLLKMSDTELQKLGIDRKELQKLQAGTHPTTANAATTLRAIAQYDSIRNPGSYQAKAVVAGLEHRSKNGFYAQPMKTLAETQPISSRVEKAIKSRADLLEQEKNAKAGNDSEQLMKQIDKNIRKTALGKQAPTNFGTQISPTTGHSFPVKGLGGVYQKPDGTKVFVKPVMDEKAALAEQRATIIARDVHGLDSPKQEIRTMLDPTDPSGKRKLIVLESPYDPKFDPNNMKGTFTKDEYFRQNVAAALRGDRDLGKGNLSGNVLADVGTAGVFEKASGKRDYAKAMPSMAEQTKINLLGVKGGAKRFFAESTLDVPKGMTADQYHNNMINEIDKVLPKLKSTISNFDLNPAERTVYSGMIARLEEGKKVNWREFHKMHSSVLATKKEALQDKKTGEITSIKGKAKPSNIVSSTGKASDRVMTQVPPGKRIVQKPRGFISSRFGGKTMLPGYADAPAATGVSVGDISQSQRLSRAQLLAATEKISLKQAKKRIAAESKLTSSMQESTKAQLTAKEKVQQFSNKTSLGIGAMSGLTIAASFAGGSIGELAQKIMPFVFGLQGIVALLPMLMNPWVALVAGITTLVVGAKLIDSNNKKMAQKQSDYIDSISATTNKMKSVGEITGKVGASELMARRRADSSPDAFSKQYNRAGQQFGTNFASSEIGKEISKGFSDNLLNGRSSAIKQFALQLSGYVSDGVINGVQAGDIARQIAVDFQDMTLYPAIIGELTSIIGPDGANILKDPLKIRIKIINEQSAFAGLTSEGILGNKGNGIGTLASFGGGSSNRIGLTTKSAAAASAAYSQTLELAKAQVDATEVQYQKDLQVLQTKKNIAKTEQDRVAAQKEIDTLTNKNKQDNVKLGAEIAKILKDQEKAFDKTSRKEQGLLPGQINYAQNAFIEASKKQVTTKFKGTQLENQVPAFLETTKNLASKDLEIKINAIAASGTNPVLLTGLMQMFKGDEKTLNKQIDLGIATRGVDETVALIGSLGNIKDEKLQKELFVKINAVQDKGKFGDLQATLTKISEMTGKDFDINTYLKVNGFAKLDALSKVLRNIQNVPDPITKTTQLENTGISTEVFQGIVDNWEYFMSLPETVRKNAITTYTTAYDMVGPDQVAGEIKKKLAGAKGPAAAALKKYYDSPAGQASVKQDLAAQATKPQYVPGQPKPKSGNSGGSGGGTTTRDTTLDDLLKKLKLTRDASINAMGGLTELRNVFKKAGGDVRIFNGLDQALSKLGADSGFIDFIGGMDNATEKGYVNAQKLKKGIIELTDDGKIALKGYQEAQLGAFSSTSAQTISELKNQRTGFVALKAAGIGSADALEMISDANFAISLRAAKTTEEVKNLTEAFKQQKKEAELTLASTDPQQYFDNQMAVATRQLNFQEAMAKRTYEPQIAATEELVKANNVLIDQAQRKLEMDATYGSRQIDKINSEIEGLNRQIATGVDVTMQQLSDQSAKLSEDQAVIGHQVDAINQKYDLQEQALSKISDLNQEIIAEKKTQISLADALTQGDISAAAQAVQDVRAASASRAQQLASDAMTAARNAEINAVKGPSTGLTATQINESQYLIDRQQYALAQQRAAIETQIAAKQEEIYKIDQLRKPIIAEITRLEDLNYNYANNILPAIKKKLDDELAAIDAQRLKWSDAQLAIEGANLKTKEFQDKLTAADGVLGSISKLWGSITDKNLKVTIQTIEEVIKQQASFVKAGNVTTQDGSSIPVDSTGRAADGTVPVAASKSPAAVADSQPTYNQQREAQIKAEAAKAAAQAAAAAAATINMSAKLRMMDRYALASGGIVPKYFASGGLSRGTDTIPAMLTPGEFVINKNSANNLGVNNLNKLNSGESLGSSVYNYSVGINVTNANADANDIARAVMGQIKYIDSQRIRGQR
jgi:TP901 family phage tail tape measure protein